MLIQTKDNFSTFFKKISLSPLEVNLLSFNTITKQSIAYLFIQNKGIISKLKALFSQVYG